MVGTRRTFMYKVLVANVRSCGYIALVITSGVAAKEETISNLIVFCNDNK